MAEWYYGNASYFDSCPRGHDCCDGGYDIAYGHWFTDQSCGILPQRGCDVRITILDRCKSRSISLPISTQCSCAGELGSCYGRTYCNGQQEGYSTPILDLTRDLFLYLHGSLTDGRVRFGVRT
jgi:hypothetical protein